MGGNRQKLGFSAETRKNTRNGNAQRTSRKWIGRYWPRQYQQSIPNCFYSLCRRKKRGDRRLLQISHRPIDLPNLGYKIRELRITFPAIDISSSPFDQCPMESTKSKLSFINAEGSGTITFFVERPGAKPARSPSKTFYMYQPATPTPSGV